MSLSAHNIVAFVNITDPDRAKAFYGGKLGLRLVSEEPPFALVFDAHGTMLRLVLNKSFTPARGTVLGWEVPDISAAVQDLRKADVSCEVYGMPGQDDTGIWSAPGGAKVAWFKDPDGNVLSVSQHRASE